MANNASISNISVDLTELSADTSPQLGGNLDLNSNNITGTGNINTTGTITSSGTITGNTFSGSGASLTNIPSAQLTGALPAISGANLTGINTDLVSDTTPQLGGNLDLNSNNITGTGNIETTGSIDITGGMNLTNDTFVGWGGGSSRPAITGNKSDDDMDFYTGGSKQMALTTTYLNLYNSLYLSTGSNIQFEGSSSNSYETTLAVTNPTADRTITLPDSTGTVRVGYQSGEIIECLSGLCDGRTVVGQSGSYTWPNGTQTVPSTSYVNFPGSVISYTPPTGTNVVKYELVYHTSYYGTANPLYHLRFYYDGTEVTVGRYSQYQYYDGANQPYNMVLSLNNGSPSIATGKIGTWNSAKEMKLMIRAYTTSYRPDVNSTHYFDGGGSRQHVYPKLTITAIA